MRIKATEPDSKHERCTVMLFKISEEEALRKRARADFREMPGMRLTMEQAMRLWDVDRQVCQSLLESLVDSHFLEVDPYGKYTKAHSGR
jgi:hypothetical protein